ncbi:MAG: serine hydrolase domain-containing protein [Pseudonocardiaceae bacterium]
MRTTRKKHLKLLEAALPEYVPLVLEATRTPGVTVAVATLDGVVYSHGHGFANQREGSRMSSDTVIPIGSVSKWFLAAMVLRLVDEQRLDPHAPIEQYITDFPVRNPLGQRAITTYDLLTHRSGLRTGMPDVAFTPFDSPAAYLSSALRSTRGREYNGIGQLWTARVGERFQYSNLGWGVLGHVVATVMGSSYGHCVDATIFAPLGMVSSCVPDYGTDPNGHGREREHRLTVRSCMGYARFGSLMVPSPHIYMATPAATGMLTTAEDLARWAMSALEGSAGGGGGGRILEHRTFCEMVTPQVAGLVPGDDPTVRWGLGVQLRNIGQANHAFGHAGTRPYGWWTECRVYPHLGLGVAVCANASDLTRFVNPPDRMAPGLITEFIAGIVETGRAPARRSASHDAWEASYAMGVLLVDRFRGVLGIREAISPAAIDKMVDAREPVAGAEVTAWDSRGFRAGIEAGNVGELTASGVRRVTDSDDGVLGRAYLDLYTLMASGVTSFPAPMSYFEERPEEGPDYAHLHSIG